MASAMYGLFGVLGLHISVNRLEAYTGITLVASLGAGVVGWQSPENGLLHAHAAVTVEGNPELLRHRHFPKLVQIHNSPLDCL